MGTAKIMTMLVLLAVLTGATAGCVTKMPKPPPTISFLTAGTGEARWKGHFVELEIGENLSGNMESWAKVKINYKINFDEIQYFSFRYLTIKGSRTPRMTLELDTNGDGIGDFWVIQWTSPAVKGWNTHNLDDWYVYPYIYGKRLVHKTLSQIQADIDGQVVAIKIVVGHWRHTDAHKVLVGYVQINNDVFLKPPRPIKFR